MARAIQLRRGSRVEHKTFIGRDGEITVDTTNKSLVVHDGDIAGGYELARADLSNTDVNVALSNLRVEMNAMRVELENKIVEPADYVVDYYPRESDMASWDGVSGFRKYNSGYIEQWGQVGEGSTIIVNFLCPMRNTGYNISVFNGDGGISANYRLSYSAMTITSVKIVSTVSTISGKRWRIAG